MDKVKLEILGLSSSQSQTGSFALVLGEVNGNRRLPIIIGMFEAQAIAIEIEKIAPNRPMTHDLFRFFADKFNFTVDEILISELREGVFYAKIVCSDGKKTIEIDSRPSDAIAIGLRFDVDIFCSEQIMNEAGIVLSEDEEEDEETAEIENTHTEPKQIANPKSNEELLKEIPMEQLTTLLDDAINNEDYEKAAILRDELKRRQ